LRELLQRWFGLLALGLAMLGGVATFAATLLAVFDVVTRRAFGWGMLGVVDLTQLSVLAIAFLPLPLVFLRDANVAVDLLTSKLGRRSEAGLRAAAAVAGALLLAVLVPYGLRHGWRSFEYGDASQNIGIPLFVYWIPLLAGAGLSIIAALIVAWRGVQRSLGSSGDA